MKNFYFCIISFYFYNFVFNKFINFNLMTQKNEKTELDSLIPVRLSFSQFIQD